MSARDDRAHWTARYAAQIRERAPSAWVAEHAAPLAPGALCLDLACGAGRHAALLAAPGRTVVALDFVEMVVRRASRAAGIAGVVAEAAALPFRASVFDLVVVVNFLDRSIVPALASLLRPGGRLIVETFTVENLQRGAAERRRGPSDPAFLLTPGELPRLVAPLRILAEHEGLVRDEAGERWVAGIVAERRAEHG